MIIEFKLFEGRNKNIKDFDAILKILPKNIDVYDDIKKLKNKSTREKTIIYDIIKKYYHLENLNDIMQKSMQFYTSKFNSVVAKYKKDVKKKYKLLSKVVGNIEIPIKGTDKYLTVPSRIGHGYIPKIVLPITDLVKYKKHKRLKVFYFKGLQCVSCPTKGVYLIKTKDTFNNTHIDIYSKDFQLMTVDHIKPKSKGGTYHIDNLDPMCSSCNSKKGNKFEE